MKICMIGTGYVGLVTGTMFADRGNEVVCVDNNPDIVDRLNDGKIHIFEPGLEEKVASSVRRGNLSFTRDPAEPVRESEVTFLAVGTPSNGDGSFNLKYLKGAARDVGAALRATTGLGVVVGKSTVPQGTYKVLTDIMESAKGDSGADIAYVSNPETLAEGTAVRDFSSPDRIIIGTDSDEAFAIMEELYHPFNIRDDRIRRGSPADAELAKLFSNTALANRVAMVNEFARIADVTPGADMDVIRRMVCEDRRIGFSFMFPSPGYGGSCFPKDIQGVVAQAIKDGYEPVLLSTIHESNERHKNYLGRRITDLLAQKESPRIAVWGLTFKPKTDDMRDAASVPIITRLLNEGAQVTAYDPQDEKARKIFGNNIDFARGQYEATEDADALVLLTEWKQFDAPDFDKLGSLMAGRQLFDLRNRWLPAAANRHGFHYFGVGRSYPLTQII
ncbi:MAG: UDP-glucose dehydrogenase family protein [Candidatus Nanoarchaeia archaeon]